MGLHSGSLASSRCIAPPLLDEKDVFPILLSTLKVNTVLAFDLYLRQETLGRPRYVLYRHRDRPFTTEISRALVANGVDRLYIPRYAQAIYEAQCQPLSSHEAQQQLELMRLQEARRVYDELSTVVNHLFEHGPLRIPLDRLRGTVRELSSFLSKVPDAASYLLALKEQDYYLYIHSINVAILSLGLARRLGLRNEEILTNIGIGGLLHDLGLTKVPPEVVNKTGPLSRAEYMLIQQHPDYGLELLSQIQGIHWMTRRIVHQHHERCDRSGYPRGLNNNEIHLGARIISLVEVYDALTHPRPYGKVYTPREALELMVYEMRDELDRRFLAELIQFVGSLRVLRVQPKALTDSQSKPSTVESGNQEVEKPLQHEG